MEGKKSEREGKGGWGGTLGKENKGKREKKWGERRKRGKKKKSRGKN